MKLEQLTDAVVMLTWSDWQSEPRSNRYHYASRFAEHVPVIFVQPDREEPGWEFEPTEISGLEILHVPTTFTDPVQTSLRHALGERRIRDPIYWVYNAYFADFVRTAHSAWTVYHATEDYFSEDFFPSGDDGGVHAKLRRLLKSVDLVVAVSEGVLENVRERGGYAGEAMLLENGCDFDFWSAPRDEIPEPERPIALFQGGLNFRVDYALLSDLADLLPVWDFWFCGRETRSAGWRELKSKRNVTYFGELTPDELRHLTASAAVGLIPFRQTEMIRRSLPLKAFEYVASSLPVVSVPIDALSRYRNVIRFARDAMGFAEAMTMARGSRHDPDATRERREVAAEQSYDVRFSALERRLSSGPQTATREKRANLLALFDLGSVRVGTLREHLESFGEFSRHRVSYAHCTGGAIPPQNISFYDGIIVHYSVRVNLTDHLSRPWFKALAAFRGYKVLFIQDEYDTTETARRFIEDVGINAVFTCISDSERAKVYSPDRFPHVGFVHNLTGYVPSNLCSLPAPLPLKARPYVFAYRGRALPFWYGDLGQEKQRIGVDVRRVCEERNLTCDIEWDDSKRIYGSAWFSFLGSARATLGTESGANVFDFDGHLRKAIEEALASDPSADYGSMREKILAGHEGLVRMNQISPKIFEAIAMRTALVLFEGEYSGVVLPGKHFISLKKDFSNIDEVLAKVMDDDYLTDLTERAYADVIGSGDYGYPRFISAVDEVMDALTRRWSGYRFVAINTNVVDEMELSNIPLGDIPASLYGLPINCPALDRVQPDLAPEEAVQSQQTIAETSTRDLIKFAFLRVARRGYRLVPSSVRTWLSPRWRRLYGRAGRFPIRGDSGDGCTLPD